MRNGARFLSRCEHDSIFQFMTSKDSDTGSNFWKGMSVSNVNHEEEKNHVLKNKRKRKGVIFGKIGIHFEIKRGDFLTLKKIFYSYSQ